MGQEEAQASFGPRDVPSAAGSSVVVYWMSGPLPGPTPVLPGGPSAATRHVTGKKIPPLAAMSTCSAASFPPPPPPPPRGPRRLRCAGRTGLSGLVGRRYDLVALKRAATVSLAEKGRRPLRGVSFSWRSSYDG